MRNDGFFKIQELGQAGQARTVGCPSCGLSRDCKHPKMGPTGEGKLRALFLAEAPGQREDLEGIQLIGNAGQRLRRTLRDMGYDLDRDFRKTNACCCHPDNNATPTPDQIAACRGRVFDEIERFKPRVIILLGGVAVQSLLGGRWKHDSDFSIGRWRNLTIPDHDLNAWVCPTFHPSYIEHNQHNPVIDLLWRKDLRVAIEMAKNHIPLPPRITPRVYKLRTAEEINKNLFFFCRMAKSSSFDMAMDFETTGRKPYSDKQRIYSGAISRDPMEAFAWLWETMDRKGHELFKILMTLLNIRKVGANIKYEHNWAREKEGFEIEGWWWDDNIAAHILDNRPGNTNVKFQAYSRLGIIDYDSHIRSFLQATGSYGVNKIDQLDPEEVLKYNGLDASLELAIAYAQREEMEV